jgi:hypothetical protein
MKQGVTPSMLGLTKVVVHDLQLMLLVQRRKGSTLEKCILLLQLLILMCKVGVVLIVCSQTHMLLHEGLSSVMLQVEQIL